MSMINIGEMYQLRKRTKRSLREGRRSHQLHKHADIRQVDFESQVGIPTKLRLRICINLFLAIVILIVILIKVIAHY
jgi:hypothetical protein